MTGSEGVTLELVRAIAAVEGVEPHEIEYSLHDYVATDAVRAMAESDSGDWELTFQVPGHAVTVENTGEIRIDGVPVRESDAVRSDEVR